jgi:hypothetical protein
VHLYEERRESKMIKHNKDLLQCVGDTDALLDKLHLY